MKFDEVAKVRVEVGSNVLKKETNAILCLFFVEDQAKSDEEEEDAVEHVSEYGESTQKFAPHQEAYCLLSDCSLPLYHVGVDCADEKQTKYAEVCPGGKRANTDWKLLEGAGPANPSLLLSLFKLQLLLLQLVQSQLELLRRELFILQLHFKSNTALSRPIIMSNYQIPCQPPLLPIHCSLFSSAEHPHSLQTKESRRQSPIKVAPSQNVPAKLINQRVVKSKKQRVVVSKEFYNDKISESINQVEQYQEFHRKMAGGIQERQKLRLYSSSTSKEVPRQMNNSVSLRKNRKGCIKLQSTYIDKKILPKPANCTAVKNEKLVKIKRVSRPKQQYKKIVPVRVIELIRCSSISSPQLHKHQQNRQVPALIKLFGEDQHPTTPRRKRKHKIQVTSNRGLKQLSVSSYKEASTELYGKHIWQASPDVMQDSLGSIQSSS